MAIYAPGKRSRNGKRSSGSRSVVFVLSLTAMVDMFTVLVVFLLQNYKVTGQTLDLQEGVTLPQASAVRELEPSNVVIVGKDFIEFNDNKVASFPSIRESNDWLIIPLRDAIRDELKKQKEKLEGNLNLQVQSEVLQAQAGQDKKVEISGFKQITIQADENIDLLSLKKIMYTIVEAGGGPINFAVLKKEKPKDAPAAPEVL
jgi:biopolymer transport protein ExbD